MIDQNKISQLQSALSTAQSIFIALPENPSFDHVAAGLGLYLSLGTKNVTIACPTEMKVEFSSLVGVNEIKNFFEGKGSALIVSFDYVEDAIEKVSYNIENNKLNLIIKPRNGHPPLDSKKVEYSYSSGKADLIFVIGARVLEDLGNLYVNNQEMFQNSLLVNIDINSQNQNYGRINLVDSNAASLSEQIASLISQLKLPGDEDIATNLLQGIEKTTNRFTSDKIRPETFEAAAFCLRMGALREIPRNSEKERSVKSPLKTMSPDISAKKTPLEPEEEKPQPDWFEPKIFRSDTSI